MHDATANTAPIDGTAFDKGASLWQDAFRRLRRNRLALFGAIILTIAILLAAITPLIAPYAYDAQDLELSAAPPSSAHWLGTDYLGRDLLTRILYGGRISLMVGFAATAVSLTIGVFYGATAGFIGGRTDATMMRIIDILYALPFTIFVIILMVLFGRNIILLFMAIGAIEWLIMARIVRGQVLTLREKEFIEAAVAMGLPRLRILTRHQFQLDHHYHPLRHHQPEQL